MCPEVLLPSSLVVDGGNAKRGGYAELDTANTLVGAARSRGPPASSVGPSRSSGLRTPRLGSAVHVDHRRALARVLEQFLDGPDVSCELSTAWRGDVDQDDRQNVPRERRLSATACLAKQLIPGTRRACAA